MLNDNDSGNLASQLSGDASRRHFKEVEILDEQKFMNLFQMLRPRVGIDGNMHFVSYGDMPEGVHGFGDTINEAIADFNKQWAESLKAAREGKLTKDKL